MKVAATNEKRAVSTAYKTRPYTHHPLSRVQMLQQASMRTILRTNEIRNKGSNEETKASAQAKLIQRQSDKEEEEPAQAKLIQRQSDKEEEEPAQAKLIQRKSDKEEEEPAQAKLIQSKSDKEEEEPAQAKLIQRQSDKEEEEPAQAKLIQRKSDKEEEEPAQAKLMQRKLVEPAVMGTSRFAYISAKQKSQQMEARNILHTSNSQAKLTLGKPNDKYEQEADHVADQVIANPKPRLQRQTNKSEEKTVQSKPLADQITPIVQRQQAAEVGKLAPEKLAQANGEDNGSLSTGFQEQLSSKGSGSPLSGPTRESMESHFGSDLSDVRVHTDSSAIRMNKEVGAQAFTHGSDIYFNEGKYNPESTGGKHLLAHELTHTVQQGPVRKKALPISHVQPSIQRWSIKGIINKILSFIPGFTLVTVFLGENPVTGDPVPQTGKMLMKGATELIPVVGPILWGELEKSGSTEKAGKWLDKKMKKLGLTIPLIKDLISKAWDAVSIWDGIDGNIATVKKVFGPYLGKTLSLIRSIKGKIREFIIEGFLRMAGSMGVQVWNILRKSPKALKKILDNPVILIKNFFEGVKLGFDNFGTNFGKHFKNSVMEWVFGTMGEAGLQLPAKFDMAGIFSIVMQVLGLTYNQIRARVVIGLAKVVGKEKAEKAISMIETGVEFVKRIITEGPIVLWDMLKEKIGDLKQMVLGAIVGWAKKTIITKAVLKLVSMLNPAGAIFQAIMMVYDVVMFFINNWTRIQAIVSGIFNSIAIAALGQVGKVGQFIEGILAKGMTVLIAFLARLIGLGGIAKKVQGIIEKIRRPITKAVDKVVGMIINLAKPIIKAIAKGGKKLGAAVDKAKQKGKAALTAVKDKGKKIIGKGGGTEKEGAKGKVDLDNLNARPVAMPRSKAEERAHLDAASRIVKKLSKDTKVKSNKDLGAYFPKIKSRYRLKEVGFKSSGAGKFDLVMTINPILKFTLDEKMEGTGLDGIKTKVEWTTASMNGVKVGRRMRAEYLGPDHKQGSGPEGGVQSHLMDKLITDRGEDGDKKYIRGHLLNDHLGGEGKDFNLYPITADANQKHVNSIEHKVKQWVNTEKYWVSYTVDVDQKSSDISHGPKNPKNYVNSVFKCRAAIKGIDGKEYDTITSNITSTFNKKISANVNENESTKKPKVSGEADAMDPKFSKRSSSQKYEFDLKLYNKMKKGKVTKESITSVDKLGEGAWSKLNTFYAMTKSNGKKDLRTDLKTSADKNMFSRIMANATNILSNIK